MSIEVVEIKIDEQKTFKGQVFPFVFSPKNPDSEDTNLENTLKWIKENKKLVEEKLLQHSVILFRNFPIKTAKDFDDVITAFGYEVMPYLLDCYCCQTKIILMKEGTPMEQRHETM